MSESTGEGAIARLERVPGVSGPSTPWAGFVVGLVLWAIVVLPMVVGLVALRNPRWYPIADLAQTELRVRDVGTQHTPLIGLAGRIGDYFDAGSHPGPLSFYLMAPTYRLLGKSAFAFATSAVVLHALSVARVAADAQGAGGSRPGARRQDEGADRRAGHPGAGEGIDDPPRLFRMASFPPASRCLARRMSCAGKACRSLRQRTRSLSVNYFAVFAGNDR